MLFELVLKQKKKLNSKNKKIIDYANHPKRNEKNDIYFLANCNFYLGSTSGIGNIPLIFGIPRYLHKCNSSLKLLYM